MAIRDWHGGRIVLLWVLTVASGGILVAMMARPWYSADNPFISRTDSVLSVIRIPFLIGFCALSLLTLLCTWARLNRQPASNAGSNGDNR